MYHIPNSYSFPYYSYANTNPYHSEPMLRRNQQNTNQQVFELILNQIQKDASAIDLYSRLTTVAPNQQHQQQLFRALEGKKVQLQQLTNLYTTLTGTYPNYLINQVPFERYEEGLQRAYEQEREGFEEYRNNSLLQQFPQIQHLLLWAQTDENITRLRMLNEEISDRIHDYGKKPYVVDIEKATKQNNTFRSALWTGKHLQVTLMSINVGDDIGLENHPNTDQFLRIEEGQGIVQMGKRKDRLNFVKKVYDDFAIMIPAGTWHNLTNTGTKPLKLYSIYAPPEHPFGTVHETKKDAMAAEAYRSV